MVARAPGRAEPGVDGGAHQRVDELERVQELVRERRAQDAGRDERVDGLRGLVRIDLGEPGRRPQRNVAAEDRDGPGEPHRGLRQPRQPRGDLLRDALGALLGTRSESRLPSPPTAERASSRSRNGFPPVAAWQARHCESSAPGANLRITVAAPSSLSGLRSSSVPCAAAWRRSISSVARGSSVRLATISATGMPSSRCATWTRTSSDAVSAQWMSSTSSASGRSDDRFAVSQ